MANLSPATMAAMRAWLFQPWYTRHFRDMERFYCFVDSLRHDLRTLDGEEGNLLDRMKETLREKGVNPDSEETTEKLRGFISDIWTILDFLESCRVRGTLS